MSEKRIRRFVETECAMCVIDVLAWDERDEDWRFVEVSLLSQSGHGFDDGWRSRLLRAWAALRGEPNPWHEFVTPQPLDELIKALVAARRDAFGCPHDAVTVANLRCDECGEFMGAQREAELER